MKNLILAISLLALVYGQQQTASPLHKRVQLPQTCRPNAHNCKFCSHLYYCSECVQDADNCCFHSDPKNPASADKAMFLINKFCTRPLAPLKAITEHCAVQLQLNPYQHSDVMQLAHHHHNHHHGPHFAEDILIELGSPVEAPNDEQAHDSHFDEQPENTDFVVNQRTGNAEDDVVEQLASTRAPEAAQDATSAFTTRSSEVTSTVSRASNAGISTQIFSTANSLASSETTMPQTSQLFTQMTSTIGPEAAEDASTSTETSTTGLARETQMTFTAAALDASTSTEMETSPMTSTMNTGAAKEAENGTTSTLLDNSVTGTTEGEMGSVGVAIGANQTPNKAEDTISSRTDESTTLLPRNFGSMKSREEEEATSPSAAAEMNESSTAAMKAPAVNPAEIAINCKKICLMRKTAMNCVKCILDHKLCCFGLDTGVTTKEKAQYSTAKEFCSQF